MATYHAHYTHVMVLFQFTDVDAGGNTVFTQIGAKVPPKKVSLFTVS